MQQAPDYQEQEQLRRAYPPQEPTYRASQPVAPGAAASAHRASLAWTDWVRWGPIWAGFFTVLSTLAIIGSLGAAIALTAWGSSTSTAFDYAWSIFTGVLAYFLGGWVAARAAGVTGMGAALLNAGLTWALSLVALLVLVIVGAGNAVGLIGSNLNLLLNSSVSGPTPGAVTSTAATASWISFVTLVVGLIVALLGGAAGTRRLQWRR